uniref:Uncharacterized protein n=1 Tax=Arundo donax TaxID=35708 RepID=A0A0A9HRK4_ARUDO
MLHPSAIPIHDMAIQEDTVSQSIGETISATKRNNSSYIISNKFLLRNITKTNKFCVTFSCLVIL